MPERDPAKPPDTPESMQSTSTDEDNLRAKRKPAPPKTWLHYPARWCILPLIRTQITPNHITTLRLLTAILAGAAFCVGTPLWDAIGGAIFLFSAIMDRADGELARLAGRTTPGGHLYDLRCDAAANSLVFVCIGVGLRHGPAGFWSIGMGIIAGCAITIIMWIVARLEGLPQKQTPVFPVRLGFDTDDTLVLIGPIAWLGWLWPFLVLTTIGAPLFALGLAIRYWRILFVRHE